MLEKQKEKNRQRASWANKVRQRNAQTVPTATSANVGLQLAEVPIEVEPTAAPADGSSWVNEAQSEMERVFDNDDDLDNFILRLEQSTGDHQPSPYAPAPAPPTLNPVLTPSLTPISTPLDGKIPVAATSLEDYMTRMEQGRIQREERVKATAPASQASTASTATPEEQQVDSTTIDVEVQGQPSGSPASAGPAAEQQEGCAVTYGANYGAATPSYNSRMDRARAAKDRAARLRSGKLGAPVGRTGNAPATADASESSPTTLPDAAPGTAASAPPAAVSALDGKLDITAIKIESQVGSYMEHMQRGRRLSREAKTEPPATAPTADKTPSSSSSEPAVKSNITEATKAADVAQAEATAQHKAEATAEIRTEEAEAKEAAARAVAEEAKAATEVAANAAAEKAKVAKAAEEAASSNDGREHTADDKDGPAGAEALFAPVASTKPLSAVFGLD